MPTLPLDPEIQGSAARLQKSRAALTKDFDPDQPRDPHTGRWIDIGSLGVGDHVKLPGASEYGEIKAQHFGGSRTVVQVGGREEIVHGGQLVQHVSELAREKDELAEEEQNNRVTELRAKVAAAKPGEERELAEEELEDVLHPGRYKG